MARLGFCGQQKGHSRYIFTLADELFNQSQKEERETEGVRDQSVISRWTMRCDLHQSSVAKWGFYYYVHPFKVN